MTYEVWDVSSWAVLADNPGGADDKDWLIPREQVRSTSREQWWLFKHVKHGTLKVKGGGQTRYRRADDRVERIACELAQLLGLPAATVELAKRGDVEGCLSKSVIPDGWSMYSGDSLLADFDGYVPCGSNRKMRDRPGHNLTNIAALQDGCGGPPGSACEQWGAFEVFAGYLVFDAWIANTDRHAVNWAMLDQERARRRLAASFDHGSALDSGSTPANTAAALDDVASWCANGMASRFENGRATTLVELAINAVTLAGGQAALWLSRISALEPSQWQAILRAVPGMSVDSRTFMDKVLTENQRRLCS